MFKSAIQVIRMLEGVRCSTIQESLRQGGKCVQTNRQTDKERTYIELVSLDDLGGRVVRIIVGLIVLVPFKAL